MSALKPPRINTEDIESSDNEHFSDASEGNPHRLSAAAAPQSPIPTTRVERIDDRPAHGEVPGTPAYSLRTQDAVPDEVEIVPEGRRSRSASRLSQSDRPLTPGGTPVPKTVVEKVDPHTPSYGEVEGTPARERRRADALPDEVLVAPEAARPALEGRTGSGGGPDGEGSGVEHDPQAFFHSLWNEREERPPVADVQERERDEDVEASPDEDANGNDFDDFAEGDDDDFGDFDEGDEAEPQGPPPTAQPTAPDILAGLPALNFRTLSPAQLPAAIAPYLHRIFPALPSTTTIPPPALTTPFLSPRSAALWHQLVSPPPLRPLNWTRSRTRRLFLVSLGVPVDLDELLPPSAQKRLVLPTLHPPQTDSKLRAPRRGPAPPPPFDAPAALRRAATTALALRGMRDAELGEFVSELEGLNYAASALLQYWLVRKDEGMREKEALEGVIENLVGFVKGRKGR